MMRGNIYVVGMGPGKESMMTGDALAVLDGADLIVGYPVYLDQLGERFAKKEKYSTGMRQEKERCHYCIERAKEGKKVALVCSGDAGVYGMASLMLELSEEENDIEISVIPGITAALSGAALLGAPLSHDFCVISLSDLLTPAEGIERRLRAAAEGDFVMVLYNPQSRNRSGYMKRAADILMGSILGDRPCAYVKNIGREGEEAHICTLSELGDADIDMFTTVFIGNSKTRIIKDKLVTPRGMV